jgi:hypothetical protein
VSRGLGALYTVSLLNRSDIHTAELVYTDDEYNLVVVNDGDYILNKTKDTVLNNSLPLKINRRLSQDQIKQKYY